ncbi:MAG: hypothetical protein K8R36_15475 [Planctomycetales bacterium]|nr:hypothetical protein [Planctomycetales bacterium]
MIADKRTDREMIGGKIHVSKKASLKRCWFPFRLQRLLFANDLGGTRDHIAADPAFLTGKRTGCHLEAS